MYDFGQTVIDSCEAFRRFGNVRIDAGGDGWLTDGLNHLVALKDTGAAVE